MATLSWLRKLGCSGFEEEGCYLGCQLLNGRFPMLLTGPDGFAHPCTPKKLGSRPLVSTNGAEVAEICSCCRGLNEASFHPFNTHLFPHHILNAVYFTNVLQLRMQPTHNNEAPAFQRFGDRVLSYNPSFEWLVLSLIFILRECCIVIGIIISGLMLGESNSVEAKLTAQAILPTLLSLFTISCIIFFIDAGITYFTLNLGRGDPLNIIIWHKIGPLRRRSRFIIVLHASLYLIQIALAAACVHVLSSVTNDGRPVWLDLPRTGGGKVMFAMAIVCLFSTILAALFTWTRLFFVRVSLASRWALPPPTAPFRPYKPVASALRPPTTSVLALDALYQHQIDNKDIQQKLLQQLPVERGTPQGPSHIAPTKPSSSPCTANLRYWYQDKVFCATCWTIAFALTQAAVVITEVAEITKIASSGRGFPSCGSTAICTCTLAALLFWVPVILVVISAVRLRATFEKNLLWGLTVSNVVACGIFVSLGLGVCGASLFLVSVLHVRKGDPAMTNGMMDEWTSVAVFGLVAESVLLFVWSIICWACFLPEPKMRGYAKNVYLHFFVRRQQEVTLYM